MSVRGVFVSAVIVAASVFGAVPTSVEAQSWCSGNRSFNAAEVTICRDAGLGALDEEMQDVYDSIQYGSCPAWVAAAARAQQRDWLRYRNSCGANRGCLRTIYAERIARLNELAGGC